MSDIDIAIRVEHLGKKYRIGGKKASYGTIRESIVSAAAAPFRRAGQILRGQPPSSNGHDEIWALKDVSFVVKRGEVVGIIGPNGAGKSTLLKILSRITKPTEGNAAIHGRVGSLLEVGTGFHPELTGRENIYLNGAVLGMKRAEIGRKFDEIVSFAEVGEFIDTPVKHFSSGMYLRLAFSVAAHLESEILLVDEVLAVGDAAFQKRCLGKMGSISKEGRTILFVSHNMGAISSLCSRVMTLKDGMVSYSGDVEEGIDYYMRSLLPINEDETHGSIRVFDRHFATEANFRLTALDVVGRNQEHLTRVHTGDYVCFRLSYELTRPIRNLGFRLRILSEKRTELLRVSTYPISGYHVPPQEAGAGYIDCIFPALPLTAGAYLIDIGMTRPKEAPLHDVENAARLEVQGADVYGSGAHLSNSRGFFICDHEWRLVGGSALAPVLPA